MDTLTSADNTSEVPGTPQPEAGNDAVPRTRRSARHERASKRNSGSGPEVHDVSDQEEATPPPDPADSRSLFAVIKRSLAVLLRPRVLGVLISGLGVLIILLLGYIYVFTPLSAERSQHTLLQQITAQPTKTYNLATGGLPAEGDPVAILEIPALHEVEAVVQGTDSQDLRMGPGHMPTSSLPGQRGNAVIAARRATFGAPFGSIGSLHEGDVIKVVDGLGTFHFKVIRVVDAQGGKYDVVTQTADNQLTLVTAQSGFFPRGRLAVIATLEGKPFVGLAPTRFHASEAELGLSGDAASGVLFVLWSLLFFALLSLTAWLLRSWRQPVVVFLLAVPVLLLVALFACESFVGALPATV